MSTNSTVNNHKNFDLRAKNFVGTEMHQKFLSLGIGIAHVKKIRAKIGKVSTENFRQIFIQICSNLIQRLEKLVATNQVYSKSKTKKIISDLFKEKSIIKLA